MVDRYNTYCTWVHNRSTGKQICPDGEHVSATDYAALEKQRDDCQQEITNCRKIIEKQGIAIAALEARLASIDQKFMILQGSHDLLVQERDEWKRRCEKMVGLLTDLMGNPLNNLCASEVLSLIAIAEGRDNG